jgi:putative flippase GtrA
MDKKQVPTYVPFYKVMLILSTIGTALAAFSLFSLPQAINEFSIAQAYHIGLYLQFVVTIVSIVALVLLWKKRVEGIQLKIGTYIAFILIAIVSFFTVEPYLQHIVATSLAEAGSDAPTVEPLIKIIIPAFTYGGLIIAIVIDTIFAFLWRAAWKKQKEEDSEA